jgi:ribonuclease D
LRELWNWRERTAREACRPPFFVLAHAELVGIAALAAAGQPWEDRVPRRMSPVRRRGLQTAVAQGLELAEDRLPEKRRSHRMFLTSSQRHAVGAITRVRDEEAARLGIDPTLIASRAAIVRLAIDWEAGGRELMPWQRELLAPARPGGGGGGGHHRSTSKA